MRFNHSNEVIQLIEQKKKNGIELGQLKRFMKSEGNPELDLSCVHIGGTNGKGSTTNVVANVLMEAGYKVATFTSPYLITHHDRICINKQCISDEVIVRYANEYYNKWEAYDLSMFEIDMFIAVKYFLENNVDFAIFEVGLGGEQDATNIINPIVCAITNIGMDHMEYLGNTYESIATTKAGIIKKNSHFITTERKKECLDIFKKICEQNHTKMTICESPENIKVNDQLNFDYKQFKNIKQNSMASYQAHNTSLAIEILMSMKQLDKIKLSKANLYEGIYNSIWKGRFEVVSNNPLIIIDGAHNEHGMDALVEACHHFKKIKVLFTALKDKESHKMIEKLQTISRDITICEFDFYRADTALNIASGFQVRVIPDYKEAIEQLREEALDDEMILICGSLYFISLARAYISE